MVQYVCQRVASGLVLLLAVSALAFVLLNIAAGDVAVQILGVNATQAQLDAKRTELGLDEPVLLRYADWLVGAARGDLGQSWFTTESVTQALLTRLPVTLSLVVIVMLLTTLIAFALGTLAAAKRGWVDRVVQVISLAGTGVPAFLIAMVLATVLAVQLGWFPATGFVPITESIGGWAWALVLPVTALTVESVAGSAQQVRASIISAWRQDYVRTLRSRGIPEGYVLFKHVLRNAAPAPLTVISLQLVGLLSGAVVVETIFGLPGLGQLAVVYTSRGDVPVVMGVVIYTVAIVVIVNLLVDIAVGWLNPKARISA